MKQFVLAPAADRDIHGILRWTQEHFGEQASIRYEHLIATAITDIAQHSERLGVKERLDLARGLFTYHLSSSRERAATLSRRVKVKHPRHFLVFRHKGTHTVEVLRVLHDRMDLERHLPARTPAKRSKGFEPGE